VRGSSGRSVIVRLGILVGVALGLLLLLGLTSGAIVAAVMGEWGLAWLSLTLDAVAFLVGAFFFWRK